MLLSIKKLWCVLSLSLVVCPIMAQTVISQDVKKTSSTITISKTKLDLAKNQKSDFFTVYNKSNNEIFGFSVEIFKWTQENGKDILEKSSNIIAAPRTFVIEPNKYKNIRFMASDYSEALKDYSYRIVLTQLSKQDVIPEEAEGNKLKFQFTMTMPLFFNAEAFKEHNKLNISSNFDSKTNEVTIINNDKQYIYLKSVKVEDKNYDYGWYVLPNSQITRKISDLNTQSPKIELLTDRMNLAK